MTVGVTDAFLASLLAIALAEPDLVNRPVSLVPLSWYTDHGPSASAGDSARSATDDHHEYESHNISSRQYV